jgi:hypothetical protein
MWVDVSVPRNSGSSVQVHTVRSQNCINLSLEGVLALLLPYTVLTALSASPCGTDLWTVLVTKSTRSNWTKKYFAGLIGLLSRQCVFGYTKTHRKPWSFLSHVCVHKPLGINYVHAALRVSAFRTSVRWLVFYCSSSWSIRCRKEAEFDHCGETLRK